MSEYAQTILDLIDLLGLEVSKSILTTDEAAQLLAYGNVVED